MKNAKWKTILFMSVAIMTMGLLAGCGAGAENAGETADSSGQGAAADTKENAGKILVAYYSATGTTERVAEKIAEAVGADTFEITPAEPYTDDDLNWTNEESRVSREHDEASLRDVELDTVTPDNWDSYDTVLLGYPIWWGIAAWPVDNFVSGNNFDGKTVIPFCTSASSGIGDSGDLLADLAGSGDWQDGERFSGGASDSDIADWVESLGLQAQSR